MGFSCLTTDPGMHRPGSPLESKRRQCRWQPALHRGTASQRPSRERPRTEARTAQGRKNRYREVQRRKIARSAGEEERFQQFAARRAPRGCRPDSRRSPIWLDSRRLTILRPASRSRRTGRSRRRVTRARSCRLPDRTSATLPSGALDSGGRAKSHTRAARELQRPRVRPRRVAPLPAARLAAVPERAITRGPQRRGSC